MAHFLSTEARVSQLSLWLSSLFANTARQPRRVPLDVRTLSNHMKRDMGLLDGNDPRGPHR